MLDLVEGFLEMRLVVGVARLNGQANWDINRACEFRKPDSDLFLIRTMIPAVSIFSQRSLLAPEDKACPIKIRIGMRELIQLEQDILKINNDLLVIPTQNFKQPKEGSFFEPSKSELSQDFRAINPIACFTSTEILGETIAQQGFNETDNRDATALMLAKKTLKTKF